MSNISSQLALGIPSLCLPRLGLQVGHHVYLTLCMVSGDLNAAPPPHTHTLGQQIFQPLSNPHPQLRLFPCPAPLLVFTTISLVRCYVHLKMKLSDLSEVTELVSGQARLWKETMAPQAQDSAVANLVIHLHLALNKALMERPQKSPLSHCPRLIEVSTH